MARSEHATRRDPRDPDDLDRKRRVKALAATERERRTEALPTIVTGDAIPITVERDHGRFVHYPASPDDLRALIERLPAGSVDGIAGIELRLGRAPDALAHEHDDPPDPLVGRPGCELIPGVYARRVLGDYTPDGARIALYAYVYDPARADRAMLELYLRLNLLSTFVHELAHHRDFSTRVARGRWRADVSDERELYAEAIERAWTADFVVPYLEETYPTEVAALRDWMIQHAGIALPLEALAPDPSDGASIFSIPIAFEQLMTSIAAGEQPPAPQIGFANDLHYAGHHDEALAILTQVLVHHPDHAGALALRADIFVHQDRLDEAAAIAQALVVRDPNDADGWEVIADVALARGEWDALHAAADRMAQHFAVALDAAAPSAGAVTRWRTSVEQRARAAIELAHWDAAAADIAALADRATRPRYHRNVALLRALQHLRRGEHREAHDLAIRTLAETTPWGTAGLRAVQLEAAHQLGVPCDVDMRDLSDRLRNSGQAAWASRLEALSATGA